MIQAFLKIVRNFCLLSKNTYQLCSSYAYWAKRFNDEGLIRNDIRYETPIEWINEYEKSRLFKFYSDRILGDLENENFTDFKYINISMSQLSIDKFLEIPGIDKVLLSNRWNVYLLDKFVYVGDDLDYPYVYVGYIGNDSYKLIFHFYNRKTEMNDTYEYIIPRNIMELILYQVFASGTSYHSFQSF